MNDPNPPTQEVKEKKVSKTKSKTTSDVSQKAHVAKSTKSQPKGSDHVSKIGERMGGNQRTLKDKVREIVNNHPNHDASCCPVALTIVEGGLNTIVQINRITKPNKTNNVSPLLIFIKLIQNSLKNSFSRAARSQKNTRDYVITINVKPIMYLYRYTATSSVFTNTIVNV